MKTLLKKQTGEDWPDEYLFVRELGSGECVSLFYKRSDLRDRFNIQIDSKDSVFMAGLCEWWKSIDGPKTFQKDNFKKPTSLWINKLRGVHVEKIIKKVEEE